jgi:hypothetical protein
VERLVTTSTAAATTRLSALKRNCTWRLKRTAECTELYRDNAIVNRERRRRHGINATHVVGARAPAACLLRCLRSHSRCFSLRQNDAVDRRVMNARIRQEYTLRKDTCLRTGILPIDESTKRLSMALDAELTPSSIALDSTRLDSIRLACFNANPPSRITNGWIRLASPYLSWQAVIRIYGGRLLYHSSDGEMGRRDVSSQRSRRPRLWINAAQKTSI